MAANPPAPGASRKISFNVSDQYDIQDVIGEGAYGVVWYVLLIVVDCIWLTQSALLSTSHQARKSQLRKSPPSITPCSAFALFER
jgi:hypothetical protein